MWSNAFDFLDDLQNAGILRVERLEEGQYFQSLLSRLDIRLITNVAGDDIFKSAEQRLPK